MGMDCPICYASFGREGGTVPRVLGCGHHACSDCISDSFFEVGQRGASEEEKKPGVKCPECFEVTFTPSVESLPIYEEGIPVVGGSRSPSPSTKAAASTGSDHGSSDGGGESPSGTRARRGHRRRNVSKRGNSNKLKAFLDTTATGSQIPAMEDITASLEVEHAKPVGAACSIPGCENPDVYSVGLCPVHTKRASIKSVAAMVDQFQDTAITAVTIDVEKGEMRKRGGKSWMFDPERMADKFSSQKRLEIGEAVALIQAVREVLLKESNAVELKAPVMIVGDVHGQYFDLLNILKKWRPDHNLLFLGDYVDRGAFSCEVILHLMALKLKYPTKVFLIRGNHECSTVSAHFGFKEECKAKYGLTVYYRFLLAFQAMPISAVIQTSLGKIFACHGGISPEISTLDDINRIDRFAEPDMEGPLCDLLWADPLNEDDVHKLDEQEYDSFLSKAFAPNQVRGCSYMFGYEAVSKFLRGNKLMYMVRAHEVQEEGFRSHFSKPSSTAVEPPPSSSDGESSEEFDSEEEEPYENTLTNELVHMHPTVLTVFSAPNYCDRYGNKAAVLHVDACGYYTVNLLEAEPHPDPVAEVDVNLMQILAMGKTCPYMPTSFRDFLRIAVEMGPALEPEALPTPRSLEVGQKGPDQSPVKSHIKAKKDSASRNDSRPNRSGGGSSFWDHVSVKESVNDQLSRVAEGKPLSQGSSRSGSWSDMLSPTRSSSEVYRMAHARDCLNEMHPDVLSNIIGVDTLANDDAADLEAKVKTSAASDEDSSAAAAAAAGGAKAKKDNSKPGLQRRQLSIDLNKDSNQLHLLNKDRKMRESRSTEQLAAILSRSSLNELVEMNEEDEEMSNVVIPAQGKREDGTGKDPSQVLFTHEEIVVLKLIFSLFDRKGKNTITRDDIVAYAEEGGDYAQLKEVDACMEAIDADGDGKVGLVDYITFASRLKEIYLMQLDEAQGMVLQEEDLSEADQPCDDDDEEEEEGDDMDAEAS
ncbi:unnamed protein product [Chrysoparadoxa australica]